MSGLALFSTLNYNIKTVYVKELQMTSWRIVRVVAGFFILLSLLLGYPSSPYFVSEWWLAFTAFVGINLLQSGLTRWCLMEQILRKIGVKSGV
jgi:hypothetical protein